MNIAKNRFSFGNQVDDFFNVFQTGFWRDIRHIAMAAANPIADMEFVRIVAH